jgi:hypothetical protein
MKFGDKLRQYLVNLFQFFGLGMIYVPSKTLTEFIFNDTVNLSTMVWSGISLVVSFCFLITGGIIAKEGDNNE